MRPSHARIVLALRCALACGIAALATSAAGAARLSDEEILTAMESELQRSYEAFAEMPIPLYYLSYEILVSTTNAVRAELGQLERVSEGTVSRLDLDLRVGSMELDNTRELRNRPGRFGGSRRNVVHISLANADALRQSLWLATDAKYKRASTQLTRVRADQQIRVDEEPIPDFSVASPTETIEATPNVDVDLDAWGAKAARYTAVLEGNEFISNRASITVNREIRYFVNTEGSKLKTASSRYRVGLSGSVIDEDGTYLSLYKDFMSHSEDGLPTDEEVVAGARQLKANLLELKNAEELEEYNGPAILSGRASGVFFHEVLGHRLEGHRLKSTTDAHTFKALVGEPVLPASFSVHFDPTLTELGGIDLTGSYSFDNEGVAARRVTVIENGILKDFLMSRAPLTDFPRSNGHGRKAFGFAPVARQSNLIVETENPVSFAELQSQLLEIVEEEGLPFGLFVDDITSGFTFTGRSIPNAFNVSPVLVYKIYPDGRAEMVRGVDLIGTPLTVFSNVLAAADDIDVFNGMCGAESGSVPVSASSPSILVKQIEVQKKAKAQERPPILPDPKTEEQSEAAS